MIEKLSKQIVLCIFALGIMTNTTLAAELPKPTGKVLLTINGNIKNHNADNAIHFDQQMLDNLPPHTFKTTTPWTEGVIEFTGVRISEILKYAGAGSGEFRANALDKYAIDVNDIDFDKIPAIIAYKKNGKAMRVRDLGPLWLMFPFDAFPKINNEKHKNASVWQLIELTVE